jgi:SAM-dependent methyltransferase
VSTLSLSSRLRTDNGNGSVSTRSLYESDLEYHIENGRRYVLNYYMPNDEDEQLRMQILHQVFLFLFDSKLTTVPLSNPTKILDIGTGTGEWAIGIGEAFPEADVTGTDISAIQPSAVPSNVFFEIFDAEDDVDWTYAPDMFDLIHLRTMGGCFNCWDLIYQRAYTHLKPGGWIEIVDFDDQRGRFLSFFPPDSVVHAWQTALRNATLMSGMDIYPAHLKSERLAIAGFTDIQSTNHVIPLGSWPSDPNVRSMVKLWLVAVLAGMEAVSLRPLTKHLGWEADEVRRICGMICSELKSAVLNKEKVKDMSIAVKVITARKPLKPTSQGEDFEHSLEDLEYGPKRRKITPDQPREYREGLSENGLHGYALMDMSWETSAAKGSPNAKKEPAAFPGVSENKKQEDQTMSGAIPQDHFPPENGQAEFAQHSKQDQEKVTTPNNHTTK